MRNGTSKKLWPKIFGGRSFQMDQWIKTLVVWCFLLRGLYYTPEKLTTKAHPKRKPDLDFQPPFFGEKVRFRAVNYPLLWGCLHWPSISANCVKPKRLQEKSLQDHMALGLLHLTIQVFWFESRRMMKVHCRIDDCVPLCRWLLLRIEKTFFSNHQVQLRIMQLWILPNWKQTTKAGGVFPRAVEASPLASWKQLQEGYSLRDLTRVAINRRATFFAQQSTKKRWEAAEALPSGLFVTIAYPWWWAMSGGQANESAIMCFKKN